MKTDLEIRNDVLAELDFDPSIEAGAVGVAVDNGVVTLSGYVSSYAEKLAAGRAAERVSGVRGVAQEIEVRLPVGSKHDDTEIAERAASVIAWSVLQPKNAVKVKVEKGWVTLRGEVNWNYQRNEAENAVRKLAGVIGVSNLITVKQNVQPTDVKRRITAALHRNAQMDANNVQVTAEGGKVTLSGHVKSLYERQLAETAAWAVPGVMAVSDNIIVK